MKNIYIITHKNCPDGFSAAWVLWTKYKDDAIYTAVPAGPKEFNDYEKIKNKIVYITDVYFPLKIIEKMEKIAKKVIIIEHHPTAYRDLKGHKNFHYNPTFSAAYLVWKFIYNKQKMPHFIKLISDNDTGTWKMKGSMELTMAIKTLISLKLKKENFDQFSKLANSSFLLKMIKIGGHYKKYRDSIIEITMKRAVIKKWDKYKIYILNANIPVLGGAIATELSKNKEVDFAIVYTYDENNKYYIITMRSSKPNVDLSKIAEKYGGGGHPGAASFTLKRLKDIKLQSISK